MLPVAACLAVGLHAQVGVVIHENPKTDNAAGNFIVAELQKNYIKAQKLPYAELNKGLESIETLVVPESGMFPQESADALHAFLKRGGDLVTLGGDPFADPLITYDGRWMDRGEFFQALYAAPQSVSVAEPGTTGSERWRSVKSNGQAKSEVLRVTDREFEAFAFRHRDNTDMDEFRLTIPALQTDADALLFRAKANGITPQTVVKLQFGTDAWFEYVVELGTSWQTVIIPLAKFVPVRGKEHVPATLQGLTTIAFSQTTLRHRFHDHDVWVSGIRATVLPDGYDTQIETGSFKLCERRDIYTYGDGVSITSEENAPLAGFSSQGSYRGVSALGFPVHGQSRYVPLLEVKDRHGRRSGWAAGMVINENGEWSGSRWAIFGVENPEWYRTEAFTKYLSQLLPAMKKAEFPAPRAYEHPKGTTFPAPDPKKPSTVSIRDGHFVTEDGKRLFIVGENLGSVLYDRSMGQYDEYSLDRLFSQLNNAGINGLRILNIGPIATGDDLGMIARIAEKWGVYLLVGALPSGQGNDKRSQQSVENYTRKLSRGFGRSPALLGYDLENEPYLHDIARFTDDKGVSLKEKYPYPVKGFQDLTASIARPGSHGTSTFFGHYKTLERPANKEMAQAYDAVNNIYGAWIDMFHDAFAKAGDERPLTAGFNLWFGAMPMASKLDFITQHTYVFPTDRAAVMDEVTVTDRLHAMFPEKPVTFGEFGYTSGYILDGRPLSAQCQAIGEMIHLLYAWANDYDGAFDWQVYDFDPVNYHRIAVWNSDRHSFKQNYERFHGIYAWDGTPGGMLKPYGMATRFFSRALAAGLEKGRIDVYKSDTQIGTGFVFSTPQALIVGDKRHKGDVLTFESGEERVVGLHWNGKGMEVMSTGDASVRIDLSKAAGFRPSATLSVHGKTARTSVRGEIVKIELLAGEIVRIE